jgi:hypothetical protein
MKRFESEFEKTKKIGRGGFACVYKVRNILDNSYYAIKKIKIKNDGKNAELQKDISSVLQEIRYLARLKSENIVNYNHSWVEFNLKQRKNERKNFYLEEEEDDSEKDNEEDEEDDYVLFEDKNKPGKELSCDSEDSISFYPVQMQNKKGSYEGKKLINDKPHKLNFDLKTNNDQLLNIGNKSFR